MTLMAEWEARLDQIQSYSGEFVQGEVARAAFDSLTDHAVSVANRLHELRQQLSPPRFWHIRRCLDVDEGLDVLRNDDLSLIHISEPTRPY